MCKMQWNKDTLKEARTKAKLSQQSLAKEIGVHWRTVQNWEKGTSPIPSLILPTLDRLFRKSDDFVSRKEYDKVVEALNSATELNRKLSDIIHSSLQENDELRDSKKD